MTRLLDLAESWPFTTGTLWGLSVQGVAWGIVWAMDVLGY